jgi:hypothetical protein
MTGNPADWDQILAGVTGSVVNGEERISTHDLLTQHLGVPITDRAARRLRRVMRRLGWRPRKLRFGAETRNGYYRKPGQTATTAIRPLRSAVPQSDNLAAELAVVAELGLQNLKDILSAPIDHEDGPLLRAKNAAAQTALNAQLRADENQLRQRQSDDVLKKLLEIIAQEEKLLYGGVIDNP